MTSKQVTSNNGKVFYQTTGVVKSYNTETGYGFLHTLDQPDIDIYVHFSNILVDGKKELSVGDEVEFLYAELEGKGLRAYRVTKITK